MPYRELPELPPGERYPDPHPTGELEVSNGVRRERVVVAEELEKCSDDCYFRKGKRCKIESCGAYDGFGPSPSHAERVVYIEEGCPFWETVYGPCISFRLKEHGNLDKYRCGFCAHWHELKETLINGTLVGLCLSSDSDFSTCKLYEDNYCSYFIQRADHPVPLVQRETAHRVQVSNHARNCYADLLEACKALAAVDQYDRITCTCILCDAENDDTDAVEHEDDCPWVLAKAAIAKAETPTSKG